MLPVGHGNEVYWECSGAPGGKPVLSLHGGRMLDELITAVGRLSSRETVFGLLFAPATVMAVVGVASSRG